MTSKVDPYYVQPEDTLEDMQPNLERALGLTRADLEKMSLEARNLFSARRKLGAANRREVASPLHIRPQGKKRFLACGLRRSCMQRIEGRDENGGRDGRRMIAQEACEKLGSYYSSTSPASARAAPTSSPRSSIDVSSLSVTLSPRA